MPYSVPKEIERVVLASEAPATRNRALCAFRGFLAWAIRNGLIEGVLTIPPEAEKAGRVRDELRRAGLPPQAIALLAEQRSFLFAESVRSEYVFATSTGDRPHPDSLKPILY